ncbi:hypothetical protein [Ovoidimarina sediminis]|uniref:hypothetical protein n=1 Tax=Ovoidimarina sediminis TaxID=3079856 RepID=UPI00290F293B|nr:hypothetical protein [Rhodophyticola sp. MJ-SS7]MDU8945436.1 hypothetical protein [Rhodophyticola sp. MJ-SS7]
MTNDVQELLVEAERCLREAQRLIAIEISSYPTPISGCDAQFNHLLAERARIGNGLAMLRREVFVPTPRTPSRHAGVESR